MSEIIRLRRRARLFALLALATTVAAIWGWTKYLRPCGPGTSAGVVRAARELHEHLERGHRAAGLRLIHELGRSGGHRAVAVLIDTLRRSHDDRVRRAVIAELGQLGSAEALAELESTARATRRRVRHAAIAAIGASRAAQAVDILRRLLADVSLAASRPALAEALGEIGDAPALDLLQAMAKDDGEPARTAAIAALGSSGAPAALKTLLRLARSADTRLRGSVLGALGQLGLPDAREELLRHLSATEIATRAAALQALGTYVDDATRSLLTTHLDDSIPKLAQAAFHALTLADRPLPPELLQKALTSSTPQLRVAAAQVLAESASAGDTDRLARLLSDREISSPAAWALALLHTPQARAAIFTALANKDYPTAVKQRVIAALPSIAVDPQNAAVLERIALSGNPQLAPYAMRLLADQAGSKRTALLRDYYDNGSRAVRLEALRALGETDDPHATALLQRAARSGDAIEQHHVLSVMQQRLGPEATATLRDLLHSAFGDVGGDAAAALAQRGDAEGRNLLWKKLQGGDYGSAWELSRLSDSAVRKQLVEMVASETVPATTKAAIVNAMGASLAIDTLASLARSEDPMLASTANSALGQRGGTEAIAVLATALSSGDSMRIDSAARALESIGTAEAIERLGQALGSDISAATAATTLARMDSERAMTQLSRHFASGHPRRRAQIVEAISNAGPSPDKRARTLLETASNDPSDSVAAAAASALARIGDRQLTAQLIKRMRHGASTAVQRALAQTWREMAGETYRSYSREIDRILAPQPTAARIQRD